MEFVEVETGWVPDPLGVSAWAVVLRRSMTQSQPAAHGPVPAFVPPAAERSFTLAFQPENPHLSEAVLGGGIVGGILILPDEATRHAALERIVAAGIDWIDTAASYGAGKSEEIVGRYLPHLLPRPRISTKFIVAPDDQADVAGAIERSLTQSLERLRRDRVPAIAQSH